MVDNAVIDTIAWYKFVRFMINPQKVLSGEDNEAVLNLLVIKIRVLWQSRDTTFER